MVKGETMPLVGRHLLQAELCIITTNHTALSGHERLEFNAK
jgi:hypothetical protein